MHNNHQNKQQSWYKTFTKSWNNFIKVSIVFYTRLARPRTLEVLHFKNVLIKKVRQASSYGWNAYLAMWQENLENKMPSSTPKTQLTTLISQHCTHSYAQTWRERERGWRVGYHYWNKDRKKTKITSQDKL